jgi:hypothetical protein
MQITLIDWSRYDPKELERVVKCGKKIREDLEAGDDKFNKAAVTIDKGVSTIASSALAIALSYVFKTVWDRMG